jgi:hypothetical protein
MAPCSLYSALLLTRAGNCQGLPDIITIFRCQYDMYCDSLCYDFIAILCVCVGVCVCIMCVHRVCARELVKKRVIAGSPGIHLISCWAVLFSSLMAWGRSCLGSCWFQTWGTGTTCRTVAEGTIYGLGGWSLFEETSGLYLTPPGIEVLDGRELGTSDVLCRTHQLKLILLYWSTTFA